MAAFFYIVFGSFIHFLAANAETCVTFNSTEGECIEINKCGLLLDLYESNILTKEAGKYLKKSQCGFAETVPKLCCPKENATGPYVLPNIPTLISRFEDDEEYAEGECGQQYNSNRIFDGTITDLEEFPWMALLIYKTAQGPALACGGVLIDKRYVLTAAHCVSGPQMEKIGPLIAVRLGEYNVHSLEDCDDTIDIEDYCAPPPVDVPVESVHPHPDYKPGTDNRHHDIALVKLEKPVNFTKFIQPICLPAPNHANITDNSNALLVICGWGKTETEEGSAIKLKAKVPVVKEYDCKASYATRGVQLSPTQLCAGGGSSDSCRGDSGGPLMFEEPATKSTKARWVALGIVSFGAKSCATKGVPAIYTNIIPYLDWINSITKI